MEEVAEKVQKEVKERGGITHITTKYTTANKETKLLSTAHGLRNIVCSKIIQLLSMTKSIGESAKFPFVATSMAGKNRNDDVPDGMAMLAEFVQALEGNEAVVVKDHFNSIYCIIYVANYLYMV